MKNFVIIGIKRLCPLSNPDWKKPEYADYLNDIEADLLNCYLNIKHIQKYPLWNAVFKAYKKGVFPCGWLGDYPEGKLVVFHPHGK